MARAAQRLLVSIGYQGAGTVEYLYEPHSDKYYFLELNPRLQVDQHNPAYITPSVHAPQLISHPCLYHTLSSHTLSSHPLLHNTLFYVLFNVIYRLQVEHPVTEGLTGVNLPSVQLQVNTS